MARIQEVCNKRFFVFFVVMLSSYRHFPFNSRTSTLEFQLQNFQNFQNFNSRTSRLVHHFIRSSLKQIIQLIITMASSSHTQYVRSWLHHTLICQMYNFVSKYNFALLLCISKQTKRNFFAYS